MVAGSVLAAEILLAIAPAERLAGVHAIAADPRFSTVAAGFAGLHLIGPNPEQLLAVRPDLVFLDAYTRPETLALLAAGRVAVHRSELASDFTGIAANIKAIGRAAGFEEAAAGLVAAMSARLSALRERAPELSSWRILSLDGSFHTYGRGSLFDAVVDASGATNLAALHGAGSFRKLSLEAVLAWRPDAIIVADEGDDELPSWLLQAPGLSLLPAVSRRRVLQLPGALLGSTSHHLVAAAEQIQATLLAWGQP